MPNDQKSSTFAEIISLGMVALICGVGAVSMLFRNLVVACLLGTIGLIVGVMVIKMNVERLEKICAVAGICLSMSPLIYALFLFIWK